MEQQNQNQKYDAEKKRGGASSASHNAHTTSDGPFGWKGPQSDWQFRNGKWVNTRTGNSSYGADTAAGSYPGYHDEFWPEVNTNGPLYMANWKMALIIVGIASAATVLVAIRFNYRRAGFNEEMERRDRELERFYAERRKRATEEKRNNNNNTDS